MGSTEGDRTAMRIGGIGGIVAGAGIVGGILGFAVILPRLVPGSADFGMEEILSIGVPSYWPLVAFFEGLFLVAALAGILLFLGLYHGLREAHPYGLYGTVFGIVGLVFVIANAGLFIATLPKLAVLYAEASAADRGVVVLTAEAVSAVGGSTLAIGNLLAGLGILALGAAMARTPSFGKGYGGFSAVVGIVSVVGFGLPVEMLAGILLVVWFILTGLKLHRNSRHL